MANPVRAKVLNAVNDFGVTLNAGKNKGITKNMYFEISEATTNTSENVQGKGIVKITEVYESFSVAERFDKKSDALPFRVGDDAVEIVVQADAKKQDYQLEDKFFIE